MGFNTAVLILNDHLHNIEKDSSFGSRLATSIRLKSSRPQERQYTSGFDVLSSQHADYDQFVIIGQNSIRRLSDLSKEEVVSALRNAAREAGLKLAIRDI